MRAALAPLALAAVAACGYGLANRNAELPAEARTISIRLFGNHTRENGLEVHLRRALEDEFRRHGVLRVVPDPDGDLVLNGDIRRFASVPVAFSGTDVAVQYQGVMQVSLRVTERASKRVVHETKLLQASQDFGAVSDVVVTTSPHFQRGTLNARDLPNLTGVQLAEARRNEALRELLDQVAHDVYLQVAEGF